MTTTGDIAELDVLFRNFTTKTIQSECTFGFKAISVGATFANLASAFKTALVKSTSGGLLERMDEDLESGELLVRDVVPGTAATLTSTYTGVQGAISGEECPPQSAFLLSWTTALRGKSFRGRTYLPGVGETQQTAGAVAGAAQTALQAVVTQMLAVFGPGGSDTNWQFVIISRFHNKVPRVPPIATPVTAGSVSATVATQRRRAN